MDGAFSFSALSIPYVVQAALVILLGFVATLTLGNEQVRAAILGAVLVGLPYPLGMAMIAGASDAALVPLISKVVVGPVTLLGPILAMWFFSASGRLERYRVLVAVSGLTAAISCAVTWTTDLVIDGAHSTSWGMWYPRAGPLLLVHIGIFLFWTVVGSVLTRTGSPVFSAPRKRQHQLSIAGALLIAVFGPTDALLAHGIGVYPLSFIPSIVAVSIALYGILRHDTLQARGLDRAAVYELAMLVVLTIALAAALWFLSGRGSLHNSPLVAALLVPLFAAAQLGRAMIRRRVSRHQAARLARSIGQALDTYAEVVTRVRSPIELQPVLEALLRQHLGLLNARLRTDLQFIPPRLGDWLRGRPEILIRMELPATHLGAMRPVVETWVQGLDADVLIPLIDRGELVGVITADLPAGGRTLRDTERSALQDVASATARALAYFHLLREAKQNVVVERDIEIALAVQQARSAGTRESGYSRCDVKVHYLPAAQFGGQWWVSCELSADRVLVAIGDVSGHSVSTALVSFAAESACETAHKIMGTEVRPVALLELLHREVATLGRDGYAMTCLVGLFDFEAGRLEIANAGHPFPYLCRRVARSRRTSRVEALHGDGAPLGAGPLVIHPREARLEPDDIAVFCSDSLISCRDPRGETYGRERLEAILRDRVRGAGDHALEVIVQDAMRHRGPDRQFEDDLTLVLVRL